MGGHGLEVGVDSFPAGQVHLELSQMDMDMEYLEVDMQIISSCHHI